MNRYTRLRKYILTKTEPKLLWIPSSHNPVTTKLLDNRNREIGIILAELELENDKKSRELNSQLEAIQTKPAESSEEAVVVVVNE